MVLEVVVAEKTKAIGIGIIDKIITNFVVAIQIMILSLLVEFHFNGTILLRYIAFVPERAGIIN